MSRDKGKKRSANGLVTWTKWFVLFELTVVLLVVAWWIVRPRTEEEKAREAFEDLVEANLDGDFEAVWHSLTVENRQEIDCWMRGDWSPFTDAEREGLSAEQLFVAHNRKHLPEVLPWWETSEEQMRNYRIVRVDVKEERAWVTCDHGGWLPREYRLVKEDGAWHVVGGYKPLERKVAAFLPKGDIDPSLVESVIVVGPPVLDEDGLASLRERIRRIKLRAPKHFLVVLDCAPDLPFQGVVSVQDALYREEVWNLFFAAPGDGSYPKGVRIHEEDAKSHPAVARVITVRR